MSDPENPEIMDEAQGPPPVGADDGEGAVAADADGPAPSVNDQIQSQGPPESELERARRLVAEDARDREQEAADRIQTVLAETRCVLDTEHAEGGGIAIAVRARIP